MMLACEICRNPAVSLWATVANHAHYRCRECRHLFVHPKPTVEMLEAYYRDATFYGKAEAEEPRLYSEAQARVRTLGELADRNGLPKQMLDIGCASGIFLEEARKAGWTVHGIELSPVLSEKARRKGLPVTTGLLEDLKADASFAVATAWEVIEHTLEPETFLRQAAARAVQGGLVAISTPLSDGIPARLLQSKFPLICPPEHLSLFSRKSLEWLGRKVGLEPIYYRSFSNLGRENLKRGLRRLVFDRLGLNGVGEAAAAVCATLIQPVPYLVDAMGLGSEMEIVFKKVA